MIILAKEESKDGVCLSECVLVMLTLMPDFRGAVVLVVRLVMVSSWVVSGGDVVLVLLCRGGRIKA